MGEINVSGTGLCTSIPDMATIYVNIRTERDNPGVARRANDSLSKTLKSGCKEKFNISEEHLFAPGPNVTPRWDRNSNEILGYVANNNISVSVKNLDQLDELIDFIHGDGEDEAEGNSVSVQSVTFDVKNKAEMLEKARTAAIRDAFDKARLYAKEIDRTVSGTISITENNMGYGGRVGLQTMSVGASADGGSNVEGGETQVEVTVNAVFKF